MMTSLWHHKIEVTPTPLHHSYQVCWRSEVKYLRKAKKYHFLKGNQWTSITFYRSNYVWRRSDVKCSRKLNQSRLGRRNPSAMFCMKHTCTNSIHFILYCIRYTKFGENQMKKSRVIDFTSHKIAGFRENQWPMTAVMTTSWRHVRLCRCTFNPLKFNEDPIRSHQYITLES